MPVNSTIFISHSHSDAALAACFQKYLETITAERVHVYRSSKSGEIDYGKSWIDWINERVTDSKITYILLTPSSFTAQWVLWEAGAVSGVQRVLEASEKEPREVIPIKFLIPSGEKLGPFDNQQVADGLQTEDMTKIGSSLLSSLRGNLMGDKQVDEKLIVLNKATREFVDAAKQALRDLQVFRREDLVQEWLSRLDEELVVNNAQYVRSARRWINIALLGAGKADAEEPIDFRIHVRLATGFRLLREWADAETQLELAKSLSPRDMMVLRELGRTELELKRPDRALARLNEMKNLDEYVFRSDPEAFNLHVRILITRNDWKGALDQLEQAEELARRDTYVANMLAIATLKVDGPEAAKRYFKSVKDLEDTQVEESVWSLGNRVNAALGLGDAEEARALLEKLRGMADAKRNKDSISRYFDDIQKSQADFDFDWRQHWS